MSTLQVANIHLESTANNRVQYTGSNTVTVYAGGVGTAAVNSTAIAVGLSVINASTIVASAVTASAISVAGALVMTLSNTDQQITGGARITVNDLGNVSGTTVTPDPGDRPMMKVTNNGTWTLAPGTNYGNYILDIVNTTGAQIPTTSGWTKLSGDSLDATTTSKFRCVCSVTADFSLLSIVKIV